MGAPTQYSEAMEKALTGGTPSEGIPIWRPQLRRTSTVMGGFERAQESGLFYKGAFLGMAT